jgi:hypothetical protein
VLADALAVLEMFPSNDVWKSVPAEARAECAEIEK